MEVDASAGGWGSWGEGGKAGVEVAASAPARASACLHVMRERSAWQSLCGQLPVRPTACPLPLAALQQQTRQAAAAAASSSSSRGAARRARRWPRLRRCARRPAAGRCCSSHAAAPHMLLLLTCCCSSHAAAPHMRLRCVSACRSPPRLHPACCCCPASRPSPTPHAHPSPACRATTTTWAPRPAAPPSAQWCAAASCMSPTRVGGGGMGNWARAGAQVAHSGSCLRCCSAPPLAHAPMLSRTRVQAPPPHTHAHNSARVGEKQRKNARPARAGRHIHTTRARLALLQATRGACCVGGAPLWR
jgi:hypothetical protein